jgi:cell division protein ZapA
MAQVSVSIGGRTFRLACNEGEEAHLEGLAGEIDAKITEMRGSFGEIGDQRLVVMAALSVADELSEARAAAIAQRKRAEAAEARATSIARLLDELSHRAETLVTQLAGESAG